MKIDYPLFLVLNPTPASEIGDIVWKIDDSAQLVRVIAGGPDISGRDISGRDVTIHTEAGSAAEDATARIADRVVPVPEIDWIQTDRETWVARHKGHSYRCGANKEGGGFHVETIGGNGRTLRVLAASVAHIDDVDRVVADDGNR